MKLTASVFGSLALVLTAACEQRSETMPADQVNAPGATSTPGATVQDTNALRAEPGVATPATPSGSSIAGEETQPVSGSDMQPMGGGGAAGHGGAGGHGGQGHGGTHH